MNKQKSKAKRLVGNTIQRELKVPETALLPLATSTLVELAEQVIRALDSTLRP